MHSPLISRRPLFWDIHENNIEIALRESSDWVIERVFEYGTLKDIFDVIDLYGREKVKQVLTVANLKPMGGSMAFLFLGLDSDRKYAV